MFNISRFFSYGVDWSCDKGKRVRLKHPQTQLKKAYFKSAVKVANIKHADCCSLMIDATDNNQHVLLHNW